MKLLIGKDSGGVYCEKLPPGSSMFAALIHPLRLFFLVS